MSYVTIRKLLEERLNTVSPSLPIAYENANYTPINNAPWQRISLLPAKTENPTMGDDFKRENGILGVNLMYPLNAGPGAASARAELIRAAFPRGLTLTSGTLRVLIDESPSISRGVADGAWYNLPVSIFFIADIF